MPGPQTQHKGTVYGDDENAPKPGLGPPVRRRPQHAHRRPLSTFVVGLSPARQPLSTFVVGLSPARHRFGRLARQRRRRPGRPERAAERLSSPRCVLACVLRRLRVRVRLRVRAPVRGPANHAAPVQQHQAVPPTESTLAHSTTPGRAARTALCALTTATSAHTPARAAAARGAAR